MWSNIRSSRRLSTEEINEEEEIPRLDISKFQAGEEERDFFMHDQELEVLTDPFGDRCCDEKEYQDALESFNEKNKEKARLGTTFSDSSSSSLFTFSWQLLTESERQRMEKLEELNKIMESIS
ncbi:hypothetical protein NC651_019439 [Populus alba x Populus x berolinensis]|nr:hypothetical protein NC651_019439 [Populus alba x Populus x berolinensis]